MLSTITHLENEIIDQYINDDSCFGFFTHLKVVSQWSNYNCNDNQNNNVFEYILYGELTR